MSIGIQYKCARCKSIIDRAANQFELDCPKCGAHYEASPNFYDSRGWCLEKVAVDQSQDTKSQM